MNIKTLCLVPIISLLIPITASAQNNNGYHQEIVDLMVANCAQMAATKIPNSQASSNQLVSACNCITSNFQKKYTYQQMQQYAQRQQQNQQQRFPELEQIAASCLRQSNIPNLDLVVPNP